MECLADSRHAQTSLQLGSLLCSTQLTYLVAWLTALLVNVARHGHDIMHHMAEV